jgi:hypothetical protein
MRRRLLLMALLGLTACLWRSYGEILQVHLDVLTQTADKLVAVAGSGRGITTEGMAEYVYPAKRGREFLRQFSAYSPRRSYRQFEVFLDRYEALVKEADTIRAQGKAWQEALPGLAQQRDGLQAMALAIRRDLEQER